LRKNRKKIFSQLTQTEKRLENISVILDGELSVDAIPLLYKSADTILRTLIALKQNPSPDYLKNIQTLKQKYGNERFLNDKTFKFLESLSEMNNHYQREMDPLYSDTVILERYQKTEKFLKSVRTFLKGRLTTEKEKRARKRIKNLLIGGVGTVGAAILVFLIIQFAQSLRSPKNGLLAHYYNNLSATGIPVAEKIDKNINFNWGSKSPHPQITGNFSARWEGQIRVDKNGDYIFTIQSDEGAMLSIDKKVLINTWSMQKRPPESSAEIHLEKGIHEIKLEYFFNQKHAALKLLWSSDIFLRQVIKSKLLFPPGELDKSQ
jgi:hypothetical protein